MVRRGENPAAFFMVWSAVQNRRADRGVRPYGSATRNAEQVLAGGVEPRPYGGLQVVRKRNPPGTALPCLPPLGKGAWGQGMRIATTSDIGHWFRNDTLQGVR